MFSFFIFQKTKKKFKIQIEKQEYILSTKRNET
jgi:hypothetical protein